MELQTSAEIVSFARKLENKSAKFYEDLSQKYSKDKDVFLSFAEENRKNVVQIERAYYGVITDAIEGCFAFNIKPEEFTFETEISDKADYPGALERAIEIERKMVQFYSSAAEQSRALMADVPRAFARVAQKRRSREPQLRALLGKEG